MADDSTAALPAPPPVSSARETIARNAASVPGTTRFQARIMTAVVVIPFLAFLLAIWLLWGRLVAWYDLVTLVVFYVPAALGITVGFHRMLTHRAFEAKAPVRAFFLAAGSTALEGGAIAWTVDHRTHHAFSDKEGDPHSPHVGHEDEEGIGALLRGLWHAHAGWMFDGTRMRQVEKYGKDLLQDELVVFFQRTFLLWVVAGIAAPGLLAFLLSGFEPKALLTGILWGGLVRIFLTHHVTWSVNSICHVYGKRPFRSDDLSTNNWVLAIPTMGESWHHNHHAFPTSAYHGLTRRQLDLSGAVIGLLERLGLVWNVRRPSSEQIDRKLEEPGALRGGLRRAVRERSAAPPDDEG